MNDALILLRSAAELPFSCIMLCRLAVSAAAVRAVLHPPPFVGDPNNDKRVTGARLAIGRR